jgi:hypothetical protein
MAGFLLDLGGAIAGSHCFMAQMLSGIAGLDPQQGLGSFICRFTN